ncbi:MAG: cytochrome c family protein [Gammaproteobacteria bacterium]|nr:cytochrome c family protein [Gammaproteobacteria bacterium]
MFYKHVCKLVLPPVLMFVSLLLISGAPARAELAVPPGVTPPVGTHAGEDVPQPIEFPHDIHVNINKINCMYCHTYARRSKVAGIPPTSKCMGCHKMIATDKPRIQKLTEYFTKKESPKWKKVHDVPDFVHFSHERHIKKFVFDADLPVENVEQVCGLCHGEIKAMTVAKKNKPLTMGFCRRCHEANGGPGDCWKCHK